MNKVTSQQVKIKIFETILFENFSFLIEGERSYVPIGFKNNRFSCVLYSLRLSNFFFIMRLSDMVIYMLGCMCIFVDSNRMIRITCTHMER